MPQYEHAVMFHTARLAPDLANRSDDQFGAGLGIHLAPLIEKMTKGAETFQGGGWEVLSHQLTPLDGHLVMSLLLRRKKAG